ncbi:MAG: hypothetical protein ACLQLG_18660 [Thermoguttaceae bacterium]
MLLPPDGLVMPVRYVRCQSGEKIVIALQPRGPEHVLRLADVRVTGGQAARQAVDLVCSDADRLHVCLPLLNADRLIAQFPRPLPASVFLASDETLSQYLVRAGLAEWSPPNAAQ